jgi:hypothetical protein
MEAHFRDETLQLKGTNGPTRERDAKLWVEEQFGISFREAKAVTYHEDLGDMKSSDRRKRMTMSRKCMSG